MAKQLLPFSDVLNEYAIRTNPSRLELAQQAMTLMHFHRRQLRDGQPCLNTQFHWSGHFYNVVISSHRDRDLTVWYLDINGRGTATYYSTLADCKRVLVRIMSDNSISKYAKETL